MVEEARPLRPQERQGLLRLSARRPEAPVAGLAELLPQEARSPTSDRRRGDQAALPVRPGASRRRAASRRASSPIRARPTSARSWAWASRRSPAARCPDRHDRHEEIRRAVRAASRRNTASASSRRKLLVEMAQRARASTAASRRRKQGSVAIRRRACGDIMASVSRAVCEGASPQFWAQ